MKILFPAGVFLVCSFCISCSGYDEAYYEKASGITLPGSAIPIESFDNGEFVTITSLRIPKPDMLKLVSEYNFKEITSDYTPSLWGIDNLHKEKPRENSLAGYIYFMKSNGKVHSTYLADTVKCILWHL
jgi:hypothetical protein